MPITRPSPSAPSLSALVDGALEIAADLERGQADQPMTSALEWLRSNNDRDLLRLSVLPLDLAAREAVLTWLTGSPGASFTLRDGAVAAISCNVARTEAPADGAPAPGPAAQAARRARIKNVQLNVATTPGAIAVDDQQLAAFSQQADVLVLAWSRPFSFQNEEQLQLYASLLDNFAAICMVTVGDSEPQSSIAVEEAGGEAEKPSAAGSFLRRVRNHRAVVWRVHLTGGGGKDVTAVLPEPASGVRAAFWNYRLARGLRATVEHLARRLASGVHDLERESDALARQRKRSGGRRGKNKAFGDVRFHAARTITGLENRQLSATAQAMQPLGKLSQLMQEIVSELELRNLEVEYTAKAVTYTVNAAHYAGINRRLAENLKKDLEDEIGAINAGVRKLASDLEGQMQAIDDEAPPLRWEELEEEPIWHSVRNLIQIGKDVDIEIPRRGIIDLLTAGRQKVFILIMLIGLAGRMGFSKEVLEPLHLGHISGAMSAAFSLVAVTVFFAAMFDAIVRWRKESKDQMARELQKIKDTVYAEGLKVFDQAQKTKTTVIKDYLKETAKSLDQQIEEAEADLADRNQFEADETKERLEAAAKRLEADKKSLEEMRKRLEKLRGETVSFASSAEDKLRTALVVGDVSDDPKKPGIPGVAAAAEAAQGKSALLAKLKKEKVVSNGTAKDAARPARPSLRDKLAANRPAKSQDGSAGKPSLSAKLAERRSGKTPGVAGDKKTGAPKPTLAEKLAAKKAAQGGGDQPQSKNAAAGKTSLSAKLAERKGGKTPGVAGDKKTGEAKPTLAEKLAARKAAQGGGDKSPDKKAAGDKTRLATKLAAGKTGKTLGGAEAKPTLAEKLAARKAAQGDGKELETKPTSAARTPLATRTTERKSDKAPVGAAGKPAGEPKPTLAEKLAARKAAQGAGNKPDAKPTSAEKTPLAARLTQQKTEKAQVGAGTQAPDGPKLTLADKLAARKAAQEVSAKPVGQKAVAGATRLATSLTKRPTAMGGAEPTTPSEAKPTLAMRLAEKKKINAAAKSPEGAHATQHPPEKKS